jgi:NAD(P)-dependent dehydrogenase (short-subunit alcohol dehydrogenase family)
MSASMSSQAVVITGSIGGLGNALAEMLHARGAKLALLDLDLEAVTLDEP